MFHFEFCVHSTVPHSQAVIERLRCAFAQRNGTASVSPPSCPLLLRDVYDAVLEVMSASEDTKDKAKGASPPEMSLHHTVYATALLLPLAQRPSNGTPSPSQQTPMRPPIVLPNSDAVLGASIDCANESGTACDSNGSLAAYCRPLLGKVHTSCDDDCSPFRVRIGITVASTERSEAAAADPSTRKAYEAPTINDETLAAAAEYRRQQSDAAAAAGDAARKRTVWTDFPLRARAFGLETANIVHAMTNARRAAFGAREGLEFRGLTATNGSEMAITQDAAEAVAAMSEGQFESLMTLFRIGASLREDGGFDADDVEPDEEVPSMHTMMLQRALAGTFLRSD